MKNILILIFTFQIFGCVAFESTYKPSDFSGGYGEEKLNENTYIVYFDANGFTSMDVTRKFFLHRAAQLTFKNEFDCFKIIEEKQTASLNYFTNNKLAQNSMHFSNLNDFTETDMNKPDVSSLSGIIQMYKSNSNDVSCISALKTLAQKLM